MKRSFVAPYCVYVCILGGCAAHLKTTVEEQGRRIDQLEQGMQQERAQLQTKVTELEQVLEQATQVVTRNSADLGAEVEQLTNRLAAIQGQLAEANNTATQLRNDLNETRRALSARIDQLADRAGIDPPIPASEIPADRTAHYQAAYQAYQSQDYPRSRALFRAYIQQYPRDNEADNAQYWIGKAYLMQDRSQSALTEFRVVLSTYSSGDAMDETLFDMADAFYRLHNCTQAQTALETLINTQGESPLVRQARTKLRDIQRAPRGYCTS